MYVAKTKAMFSCVVTAYLICAFAFAYVKRRFSHYAAHNTAEEIWCIFDDNSKIIFVKSS